MRSGWWYSARLWLLLASHRGVLRRRGAWLLLRLAPLLLLRRRRRLLRRRLGRRQGRLLRQLQRRTASVRPAQQEQEGHHEQARRAVDGTWEPRAVGQAALRGVFHQERVERRGIGTARELFGGDEALLKAQLLIEQPRSRPA